MPRGSSRGTACRALCRQRHRTHTRRESLFVQRNFQFFGKQVGIERTARYISPVNFERRNFSQAVVRANYQFFGVRLVVDIHFLESDSALAQELLRATAIAAPGSGVNSDFRHFALIFLLHKLDAARARTMPCALRVISLNIYRLDAASTRTSARCKAAEALCQSVSGEPVAFASSAWA